MQYKIVRESSNELYHYGITGMHWGIRRFQEYDGTYTPEGRERYGIQGREMFKQKKQESNDRTTAMNDDMKAVNGGVMAAKYAKDRRANCAYCTTAYELRRRGYDVKAKESITGVMIDLDPSFAFKDAKAQYFDSAPNGYSKAKWKEIENQIVKEQGEGARGNLFGSYKNSFAGHSVAYEIQNGKMVVLDCQIAKRYDDSHEFTKDFKSLGVIRTDNLEVDENYISDLVGNRSEVRTRMDVGRMAAKTLMWGGLGALSLGGASAMARAGQIAIPAVLAGLASIKVASMINKNQAKREYKAQDEMIDKTLKKLNIDVDEANRRLDAIRPPQPAKPTTKPKSSPKVVVQPAVASRIRRVYASGSYTQEELAKKLGLSVSTIGQYV